jgi:hypothetical protein
VRFRDLLRVSVLLFGGSASALAVVSIVGAADEETNTLLYVSAGWWTLAIVGGLWVGRREVTTPGIATLLAEARRTNTLPELEPGTVMFNRLWPLIVLALGSAIAGFFIPQVPAIATGYCLLVALLWRKQSRAVEAVEGRDGVEFWLEKSSPFGRPSLLRLPGLRRVEPA